MPGTIQVTGMLNCIINKNSFITNTDLQYSFTFVVLEFKGASSSSKPSAKSLKVSMGKTQYQTWDKGDFSFPITKLREDLVVTLLDAGGNEIARADIRTMQIIERGSWDEVFSINDGGHVHMKLQFILNEEERNRIRIVRESAMKKKLETNPNINLKPSETVSSDETSTENEHKVSGKQVMNIVGNQRKEAKAHQAKKTSSEAQVLEKNPMHGTKHKMEKNPKRVAEQPESGHGSSLGDSSRGVIGQVIKIAVILGFGALVLRTRQKEPRKKQKEQNDDLFPIPDYIDERTMKPWPLQQ